MTLYTIALFLHVLGAIGLFVALGLEWVSLSYLRRSATVDDARLWTGIAGVWPRVGGPSGALILLAGIFMTVRAWGWELAWIRCAMLAFIAIAALGGALSGPAVSAIRRALPADPGAVSPALRRLLGSPRLSISLRTRTAIALGAVFLMTVRPDTPGAIATLIAALLLGLAWSIPSFAGAKRGSPVSP